MRIYVASSWRNNIQAHVVRTLRAQGHRVYDFKNPAPDNAGFHWKSIRVSDDVGPTGTPVDWKDWTPAQFQEAIKSDIAKAGFALDMNALEDCEACVLVLPCGKSAHLELGQAVGAGKRTIVYMPFPSEPELMYLMCDHLCLSLEDVIEKLKLGPRAALDEAYARDAYDRLASHMHNHAEHAGLPAPTSEAVSQAFARLNPNAVYGKMAKPQVWYGVDDAYAQGRG